MLKKLCVLVMIVAWVVWIDRYSRCNVLIDEAHFNDPVFHEHVKIYALGWYELNSEGHYHRFGVNDGMLNSKEEIAE